MSQNYFFKIHSSPIIQNINNSTLSGAFAMPVADINMNRDNEFSMNRHLYSNENYVNVPLEKKWVGVSNRDSSSLTSRRRVREVGNATTNRTNGKLSFVSNHENNSRIEALARVRGGGYVVPPKTTNSPHHTNAPTPFAIPIKYAKKNVLPPSTSRLYTNMTFCEQNNCLPNYTNVIDKKLHP